jgi:F-type H+-transporting ATPase subunit b
VWLLKRFLYKPILDAIDAREKLIAKELADAAAKEAEATKERDEFQRKNEEFDRQRADLWNKAISDAKSERQRLLDAARKDADTLSAKRADTLLTDARNLNQAISRRAQQEVFSIARKTLTDLADANLEQRMSDVFTQRLRALNGDVKGSLGKALKAAAQPAIVRSAFDLPIAQQAAIQNAINETFAADVHLRFETAPDLVSGIELATNGHRLSWSIADYLTSLEEGVGELLKEIQKAEAKAEPNAETKVAPKAETKVEPKAQTRTVGAEPALDAKSK